jgi:dUTPase
MTEPTDLTGWTAASQIRNKPDGRRVVDLDCTIELPNIIDVALLPIPSRSVVSGEHDIQLTSDDGRVMTVVRGDVTVVRNITVEPIYP